MRLRLPLVLLAAATAFFSLRSAASDVPGLINYQGRVVIDGVNYDGPGEFKFALITDPAGPLVGTLWSHNGTSFAGAEPSSAGVAIAVQRGLFSVALGATQPISENVFASQTSVWLRVWFRAGASGAFQQLAPDTRLLTVPYAFVAARAEGISADAIDSAQLSPALRAQIAALAAWQTASKPVITSAAFAGRQPGEVLSYQITATNNPTVFTAQGLPGGVSLNANTGAISGVPTGTGIFPVTLSASNPAGTGTLAAQFAIGNFPAITSALNVYLIQGAATSFQITASNQPTSFGASGLPSGLSVDGQTGLITGTPAVAGQTSVGVTATNAFGTGQLTCLFHVISSTPGIFVDGTSGDDSFSGSSDAPVRSIARGLELAQATGATRINVAKGLYFEISLVSGISLYGGYEGATWTRDTAANVTTLYGVFQGLAVTGITSPLTIDGFRIQHTGYFTGLSGYAVLLADNPATITFANDVLASNAVFDPGADGANGTSSAGASGNDGTAALEGLNATSAGGAGGGSGASRGGNGGNGWLGTGQQGAPSTGAAGGFGGAASSINGGQGADGGAGADGANGTEGLPGTVAAAFGSDGVNGYLSSSGNNGTAGTTGVGGGGGGAGGGNTNVFSAASGGGGGGGGQGGTGASGGMGGAGGCGAFGIYARNTHLVVTNCTIQTNGGSSGDKGGSGGPATAGSPGGQGGAASAHGGHGGNGGNGGQGGAGGAGSGGAGGPSIGIYTKGGTLTQSNNTFQIGSGGAGGAGGTGISGTAPAGPAGISTNVRSDP